MTDGAVRLSVGAEAQEAVRLNAGPRVDNRRGSGSTGDERSSVRGILELDICDTDELSWESAWRVNWLCR